MSDSKLVRKAKQHARRLVEKSMDEMENKVIADFQTKVLRKCPRFIPNIVWEWSRSLFINKL